MELNPDAGVKNKTKYQFKDHSEEEIKELLTNKDRKSTQHATQGALNQFNAFLKVENLPDIEDLNDIHQLSEILQSFYTALRPIKSTDYSAQSLKCIHSGLNRYMRKEKGIDICNNEQFTRANEVFTSVLVDSKNKGKAVKKSFPPISNIDLERICKHFNYDDVTKPNPKRLQQQMIFYIIYYFCRRGRENLYGMTVDTFKLVVEPDGQQFVIQDKMSSTKTMDLKISQRTNKAECTRQTASRSKVFLNIFNRFSKH